MAAVREYGRPLADDPARLAGVEAIGVDETAFLAATATHHTVFVTGLVDVARSRLLDVVPGRSGSVLAQWIGAQPEPWRNQITVAALDPFRGYPSALRTALPEATRVLDADPGQPRPAGALMAGALMSRQHGRGRACPGS